jgi:hypothetical protein
MVVGGVVVVVVVGGVVVVVVVVEVGVVGNVFITDALPARAAIIELSFPSIPIAHAPTPLIP